MPVCCHDILADAEQSLGKSTSEVQYRNVVGRAYYACYHRANAFHEGLPSKGENKESGGVHARLSFALRNPTVEDTDLHRKSKLIGRMCRDLHTLRAKADYKLNYQIDHQDALEAIAKAKRIFKIIEPV